MTQEATAAKTSVLLRRNHRLRKIRNPNKAQQIPTITQESPKRAQDSHLGTVCGSLRNAWSSLGTLLGSLEPVLDRLQLSSAQHRPKTKPRPLKTHPRLAQDGAEDPPETPELGPVLFFAKIFERRKKSVQKSLQKTGQERPGAWETPRNPREPQETPREPQETPKRTQESPMRAGLEHVFAPKPLVLLRQNYRLWKMLYLTQNLM